MLGIKLREEAKALYNTPLKDLCKPETPWHIVAIKRDDATLIPGGFDELKLGDIAYFMTTKKYVPLIREIVGKDGYADVRKLFIMGGGRISVHTCHILPTIWKQSSSSATSADANNSWNSWTTTTS